MTPYEANPNLAIQATTVNKLAKALQRTTEELIATRTTKPSLSVVALLARNLLELRVWIEFCTKSAENARRFRLDAVRDFDIIKRVPPLFLAGHTDAIEMLERLANARTDLESVLGPGELDEPQTPFSTKVAKDLGIDTFERRFNVLSKLAHPTAFIVIMEQPSDESYTLIQDAIIKIGLGAATEATNISQTFNKSVLEIFKE